MNQAAAYYPESKFPSRPAALHIAQDAHQCVQWLKCQGFDVLFVQAGSRLSAPPSPKGSASRVGRILKPRVYIRTSPLCEQLEGAVWMYERITHNGNMVSRRYWVAIRLGCEVRWTDEGGSHAER